MSNKIKEHYQGLLNRHGDDPSSAQYSSKDSQYRRFAALSRIGNVTNKRVLDFGCGTASLADYFLCIGQPPSLYHGVDVVEDFFVYAQKKMPDGIFTHPDDLLDRRFDYAFISGVFNNYRRGNRKFWKDTIKMLFERCDIGIAFNMMSSYVDYKDKNLFYEDPCRVFEFVKREISPYVVLHHDYLVKENSMPFEFNIFVYRDAVNLSV
jgi:hypothetical protein